ncbi:MAG: hypothetical protein JWO38_526 [Gemmataceae bacterium]|nr:hypothetical protein [Gemmataceae bacterium]
MPRTTGHFWFRRGILVTTLLSVLLAGYFGSYAVLSRRGMAEMGEHDFVFFYVPVAEIGPESAGLSRHYWLRDFYHPINQVDHEWFGGGTPCGGITWG